jgi:homogentisate 1,2-dioxygenase
MALIVRRGLVPQAPHTEFYGRKGLLSLEEIHGSFGFSGAYSRKMHLRRYPTIQVETPRLADFTLQSETLKNAPLSPFHILTGNVPYESTFERSRHCLLKGSTTSISVSKPTQSTPINEFFRNGEAHECLFVQEGQGVLASEYGELEFHAGQYLVIPKGTTYQVRLSSGRAFFLVIESLYPIHFTPHYLNAHGQATLMAPIVETEIGIPKLKNPKDRLGKFPIWAKHSGGLVSKLILGHHPFDLVGWEGAFYPFTFDNANHHSISREIHTAPPVRQTFQAGQAPHSGFSICTFRAQIEGWNPQDVPAPYAHYNVDSDEAMFFSNTSYGARSGLLEPGSITFHPAGLPHSPHGNAAKNSFKDRGKLSSYLAVMLDTFFESLVPTKEAEQFCDKDYSLSWAKAAGIK